ncbi:MAG: ribose-phosphate pyrophosphokinase, partial [Bacteroidales bacterium]|nr:ribose-phosphate pyrophosphokinase [Bacteroidales bacterium]
SGPAYDRIASSAISELVVSDTIPLKKGMDTSKIKVLSVAELFADVIDKVYNYESISEKFII